MSRWQSDDGQSDDEWVDDDLSDDVDSDGWCDDDSEEEVFPCPECGEQVHVEADACPSCGYWITDTDRERAWRAGSASSRIRTIGLWLLALAAIGYLLASLR